MFSFKPLSDSEINALNNRDLLPAGIYPFVVKSVEQSVSNAGIPMLKVRLGVFGSRNDQRMLYDFLSTSEKMMFKLKHFCESIGLGEQYKAGNISFSDCIDRSGKVNIGIQKGTPKPDGSGNYSDKNSVKDYVPEVLKANVVSTKEVPFFNDDINF